MDTKGDNSDYDHFMEKVRLVVIGEAATLSTFFLKNNQRLTKANYVQLSRLSSMILEDEDAADLNDENLVVDPLIKNLILLKSRLSKDKIASLESAFIKPFCDVIVNKDVSGPITGLALQSILKFLNYEFIKDGDIIRLIAESVTKARFVGTDSSSDEVVLMRILSVLENLIVQPFYSLTNGLVCEIMQSCFRIAFESRLSELLRKCAIKSLTEMVRALFGRISHFDQDISDYNYFYQDKNNASFHKLNRMGRRFVNQNKISNNKQIKINKEDLSDSDCSRTNYGLACIHELLAYLTSLINPLPDGQNTDSMILVGLNLLIVIFETAVHDIGSKHCLLSVVKTDLCWNVMQLLQNEKNLNTYASVLRLAFLIFVNLRMHLKYQFESFLLRLMDIITTMNAPLEFRDITIENMLLLFRHIPYLSHELFFNFDCDPYASNVLEDLLQLFLKNCFANSNNQNTSNVFNFTTLQMLSFEVLLSNLKSLQKVELSKKQCFTANPAIMIVNISNIKDVFADRTLKEENDYNVCNNVKDLDSPPATTTDINSEALLSSSDNHSPNITPSSNELENFELVHNSNGSLNEIGIQPEPEFNSTSVNKYCVTYLFPDSSTLLQSKQQIAEIKQRKTLLWTATERFNQKPTKGIEFLYENNLVSGEDEIVAFLRNNPKIDKKQMGEFLSNKKNMSILSKFVQNFTFKDVRIDEALRLYLESFRLPGESPLISLVLEEFAHHWHESNNCPFANEDAAFSLAYAIIMLNVDQHNTNVRRSGQSLPMTCDEFISNLRQVNGGKDFDRNMLSEIYYVIKSNEIIMPAEQTGVVKEKYTWKCLLKNSETANGIYWFNDDRFLSKDLKSMEDFKDHKDLSIYLVIFNKPIFDISWGPSISTLTLVFGKLNPDRQPTLSRRILNNGFNSYSLLCANYGHLDNLIVNLSKFVISSSKITNKSELVAHCLFGITKEYANEIRTSWTNLIELILFWYDKKLLDNGFEIEDFAINNKKFQFARKIPTKNLRPLNDNGNQSTFLSSFYSYFASNPQNEDIDYNESNEIEKNVSNEAVDNYSDATISRNEYCQALVLIIEESKFLQIDSLIELIKALIHVQLFEEFDDDIEVFKLEILVKVILMNRDRLSIFWDHINKHIIKLMKYCPQSEYLTERIISSVFRLAIRFTPRPDTLNDQIFLLIYQMLLTFDPIMLQRSVTAQALYSFVSHCNCFFTKNEEWALIFNLILAVAIGYYPSNKKLISESAEANSRGYTSDSELTVSSPTRSRMPLSSSNMELSKLLPNLNIKKGFNDNGFAMNYSYRILDVEAYEKCADILSLIITEYMPNSAKALQNRAELIVKINSYEIAQMAVGALCKYVEASVKVQISPARASPREDTAMKVNYKEKAVNRSRLSRFTNAILSSSESDSEEEQVETPTVQPKLSSVTEICSFKLLNLMHYFHLNSSTIVGESVSVDVLWNTIWCPILQAISFFCCDCRRPVRTDASTILHRMLAHDLKELNAVQWESCFNKVLFPLLSKLLEPINMCDPIGMDDTRMRTTNLLCKVFLQHLHPLLSLNTFTALWLTILDFMDKYIKADMQTDLVREAIPESLKNILLVMKTAGCFNDTLAAITWDRINVFLPSLYQDLMFSHDQYGESEQSGLSSNNEIPLEDQTKDISSPLEVNSVDIKEQTHSKALLVPQSDYFSTVDELSTGHSSPSTAQAVSHFEDKLDDLPMESGSASGVSSQTGHFDGQLSPSEADVATPLPPPPPMVNYNIPSTFIDMESICVYQDQVASAASKPTLSFSHFPGNSYPGTIAQFNPDGNSSVSNYFHYSNPDKNSTVSPYPWPSPNLSDNPLNK